MRLAILDDIHHAYESSAAVARLRERGVEVRIFTEAVNPAELRGFDALLANRERTRFSRELLRQLPDLQVIAQTGAHAYHIDFAAARELGITVAKAPGRRSNGPAELTIGLMLALMRGIAAGDAALKAGRWPAPLGQEMYGKSLGLVGFGKVGQRVAKLARAFEMRLLAWSPSLTRERAQAAEAELRPLDELLAEADVVSIHVSLSAESRGLIDARRLGLMRPSAYLVNTSRGPIVDEAALVQALRSKRIAAAALDVFDQEPLPPDHPLRSLPNVVLTPHLGWPTDNAYEGFAESAADALLAYLDGSPVARFDEGR